MLGQQLDNLATGNGATGSVPGAFTVLPYFGYVQESSECLDRLLVPSAARFALVGRQPRSLTFWCLQQ